MNIQKLLLGLICSILILLLAGCSESADDRIKRIKVTFDGNECTVSGITELTVGDHSFVLKNLTEDNISLQIGRIMKNHSFQDFVDNIEEQRPGRSAEPDWLSCCETRFVAFEKGESADEEIDTLGILHEGEHAIYVRNLSNESIWPCAPLKVVEASSE